MRAGVFLAMLSGHRKWRRQRCPPHHCRRPPPETDCLSLLRGGKYNIGHWYNSGQHHKHNVTTSGRILTWHYKSNLIGETITRRTHGRDTTHHGTVLFACKQMPVEEDAINEITLLLFCSLQHKARGGTV